MDKRYKRFLVVSMVLTMVLMLFSGCSKDPEATAMSDTIIGTCTISIDCSTLLSNMDILKKEKHDFVPEDGMILKATTVDVPEGANAHDILKSACTAAGIHMESSYTPLYESAYIEGINQLYEFDGGELSGWMYKVNGEFPNYGVSNYEVKDGDVIEFVYTCDLGEDVGHSYKE